MQAVEPQNNQRTGKLFTYLGSHVFNLPARDHHRINDPQSSRLELGQRRLESQPTLGSSGDSLGSTSATSSGRCLWGGAGDELDREQGGRVGGVAVCAPGGLRAAHGAPLRVDDAAAASSASVAAAWVVGGGGEICGCRRGRVAVRIAWWLRNVHRGSVIGSLYITISMQPILTMQQLAPTRKRLDAFVGSLQPLPERCAGPQAAQQAVRQVPLHEVGDEARRPCSGVRVGGGAGQADFLCAFQRREKCMFQKGCSTLRTGGKVHRRLERCVNFPPAAAAAPPRAPPRPRRTAGCRTATRRPAGRPCDDDAMVDEVEAVTFPATRACSQLTYEDRDAPVARSDQFLCNVGGLERPVAVQQLHLALQVQALRKKVLNSRKETPS
jgi:hypothetical protein